MSSLIARSNAIKEVYLKILKYTSETLENEFQNYPKWGFGWAPNSIEVKS